MYKIKFAKSFVKDFKKIPKPVQKVFFDKWILRLQEDPKVGQKFAGKNLSKYMKLAFRYKRNDYRIVYQVHKKQIKIILLAIGSRENFYKKLKLT